MHPRRRTAHSLSPSPKIKVCEIITLPQFNTVALKKQVKPDSIVLSEAVLTRLHAFVTGIAAPYKCNPFHNFEHASHVAMSVVKLLSRMVAPSDLDFQDGREASSTLHDHTYGITSDPLTQFACVVSALIHDAYHPGVPNAIDQGDCFLGDILQRKEHCRAKLRRFVLGHAPGRTLPGLTQQHLHDRVRDEAVPAIDRQFGHGLGHYGQGPQGAPQRAVGQSFCRVKSIERRSSLQGRRIGQHQPLGDHRDRALDSGV